MPQLIFECLPFLYKIFTPTTQQVCQHHSIEIPPHGSISHRKNRSGKPHPHDGEKYNLFVIPPITISNSLENGIKQN